MRDHVPPAEYEEDLPLKVRLDRVPIEDAARRRRRPETLWDAVVSCRRGARAARRAHPAPQRRGQRAPARHQKQRQRHCQPDCTRVERGRDVRLPPRRRKPEQDEGAEVCTKHQLLVRPRAQRVARAREGPQVVDLEGRARAPDEAYTYREPRDDEQAPGERQRRQREGRKGELGLVRPEERVLREEDGVCGGADGRGDAADRRRVADG
mmetsp:Transcript_31144/g.99612  ORF Transcript_31144/g.99612 Transcript_31144/m.99612 type:complete len:209 (+) Transcript_31144:548-1174(+)